MSNLYNKVLLFVASKMDGEDRSGHPEIQHPMRVSLMSRDLEGQLGGLLHDVLEDTDATVDDLHALGVGTNVIRAVVAVTRIGVKKGDTRPKETYAAFIERIIASGKLAVRIKLNDLSDNLARIHELPEGEGMRIRYERARDRLLQVWDYER